MLPKQRKQRIADLVEDRGGCSVDELAEKIGVSSATIRRDLSDLEERKLIERTHGGATPVISHAKPYEKRKVYHVDQKRSIAERAVEEIREDQVVAFDSGSTLLELAKRVPKSLPITPMTRMPSVAYELAERDHEVYLTGGTYQKEGHSCVGPWADEHVKQMNADLLFLGTDGIDEEGMTAQDIQQAQVKRTMIDNARRVVLTVDHSKFDKRHAFQFGSYSSIDVLITDSTVPKAVREGAMSTGVHIIEDTYS
ncbi:HTH-type transcriptional regulator GlpR [Halalkalicoccus jeotgali]|uniref:DeoR-type DNA-binding transcriptional regulator n=1 Tax=Halalkalicoccus jeotgali (strain DSM 18796 / CECT 7217 / JCM 14584 / KCTC 4019 / B3) TaxID=795797 RepID=D8JB74_HALJB|nr:HTH-type transcriptional regulator GlpR [Halalkalicoccus jeotgali]ADJ16527.1 DeoR-type DNA-binding transcriptional regulator [Halalkalicoccus jeotgali B3]ELY41378.1 DeoR-type DNA-binding transcriptional regulator [Halalkalicoccus jeotgali B3]